jgi:hypothetical protein
LEKGITTPVKHRIRRKVKPSVCKHCENEPSEDRAFKSRFQCIKCYYERLPPEKLEAYREQAKEIKREKAKEYRENNRESHREKCREYYQELQRVYKLYKSNQLQPVGLVQPRVEPVSAHSSFIVGVDINIDVQ